MIEGLMGDYGSRLLIAVAGVGLALLCLFVVLAMLRRRSGPSPFLRGGKNRQPRLQVLDAAAVDARRRIVLVRRDDVEHLVMIGGPTDIVIESGIRTDQPTEFRLRDAAASALPQADAYSGQASLEAPQRPAQLAAPAQAARNPVPVGDALAAATVPAARSETTRSETARPEVARPDPVREPVRERPVAVTPAPARQTRTPAVEAPVVTAAPLVQPEPVRPAPTVEAAPATIVQSTPEPRVSPQPSQATAGVEKPATPATPAAPPVPAAPIILTIPAPAAMPEVKADHFEAKPSVDPVPANPAPVAPPPAPVIAPQPPAIELSEPASTAPMGAAPDIGAATDALDAARQRVFQPAPERPQSPLASEDRPTEQRDAAPANDAAPPRPLGSEFDRILEEEMAANLSADRVAPEPAARPGSLPRRDPANPRVTGATPEPSLQTEIARIFGEMSVTRDDR